MVDMPSNSPDVYKRQEVHRLRRGVDHMRAITGELFYDVSAGLAARDGERTIGRSPVGPDDGAAGTGGVAAQVTDVYKRQHEYPFLLIRTDNRSYTKYASF